MADNPKDKPSGQGFDKLGADNLRADKPEQIPLLEDVIFTPHYKSPAATDRPLLVNHVDDGQHQFEPRTTELFPQILVLNGAFETAKQQADIEQIAGLLVSTHPVAVIRKLRDELSLLLDDLEAPALSTNRDEQPPP
ncbi:MAG: hypothetical protein ACI90G_000479 [Urechidicola sp.]|jgi:hypothetical protein